MLISGGNGVVLNYFHNKMFAWGFRAPRNCDLARRRGQPFPCALHVGLNCAKETACAMLGHLRDALPQFSVVLRKSKRFDNCAFELKVVFPPNTQFRSVVPVLRTAGLGI